LAEPCLARAQAAASLLGGHTPSIRSSYHGRPGTWSYDDPPPVIPRRIAARASLHCAISSPSFADIPRPPAAARSVALQGTREQPPGRPRAAQRRPAGRCERDRDHRGQYLRGPPGGAEAANASLLPTPRRQLGRTAACYLSRISDFQACSPARRSPSRSGGKVEEGECAGP
jgi:hypothetical protein